MTANLSKRHQARNERALQELIKTVPGNDRCADCGARNPGWASWSLGIFLCMRCASIHRKLGTHISKIKSLSMDSWSNEQVDSMKRNGNVNTNKAFNPQNTKPSIPLDVDEVDAVLEKFIRQKYDQQVLSGGRPSPPARVNHTGSTGSSDDRPPPPPTTSLDKPLPPKPGRRFGFGLRSSSSTVHARSVPTSPPHSPHSPNSYRGSDEPLRINKQSRVFGTSVGGEEIEGKLAQLRDMGFTDEKRNATVLKGLSGNLEKTIESLVRLGEGSAPNSRSRTPNPGRNVAVSQPLPQSSQSTDVVNGISFANNGALSQTSTGSQSQQPPPPPPPQTQTVRNFTSPNPFQPQTQPHQTHNPFFSFNQQQNSAPLENAFAGMQISQPPLFPNATGGYPTQAFQPQEARYQTMTPPVPQLPQQYAQSSPYTQQSQAPQNNYNPFFQATQQPIPVSSNPYAANMQPQNQPASYQQEFQSQNLVNSSSPSSPQTYSPQVQQGQFQQPPYQQPQQQLQQRPPHQQHFSNSYAPQYSMTDSSQYTNQQQPLQQSNQFQPQPLQPQLTGRVDKSTILALYNYPQLAPPPQSNILDPTSQAEQSPIHKPQRSVTMPTQLSTGSRNPFQPAASNPGLPNGSGPAFGGYRHTSQESVDIGGYQNGRNSPDAFANLSSQFVR
ncbi:hypothetical protein MMC21_004105 [Puttea exsequens]|nr:hypothetical protein [Puttea exsequens]